MTGWRRIVHAVVTVALWVAGCPVAPAGALTPPVIDTDLLPAAATPAPPVPTTQRSPCAEPAAGVARGVDAAALADNPRGDGQRVAVIDTGVHRHPRLTHLEGAGDYVSTGDGTEDCDGHGTAVAGIIADIAPAATLLAIRQSTVKFGATDDPGGSGFGDVDTMARAVRTAADLGATVVNISAVACAAGPLHDAALGAALAYAVDVKDVVVVTAAGNVAGCPPQQRIDGAMSWAQATVAVSPAWYDDYVLTVGSLDDRGRPSEFTQPGPWVDVAAPGENMVPGAAAGIPVSGTSYAAPVVSGVVALLRARSPELTARQVMARISSTARGSGQRSALVGFGALDPVAALGRSGRPAPPAAPAAPVAGAGRPPGQARVAAVVGAGVCVAVAALTLAALSLASRSRRP